MKVQLIRHGTLLLTIKSKRLLIDPMLSVAGTMAAIPEVPNKKNNPLVELPIDPHTLINVDGIMVTHTHRDHFDDAAAELLPKHIPVFCQPEDTDKIRSKGFLNVHPIENFFAWNDITFYRTKGRHGEGEIGEKMGPVSGFVIEAKDESSIYIMGDTIWCKEVEQALALYHPQVIVSFAGAAQFNVGSPITMTSQDIWKVCKKAPYGKVIAAHMEAWNHCRLSRKELKDFIKKEGLSEQVYVPEDGEWMYF